MVNRIQKSFEAALNANDYKKAGVILGGQQPRLKQLDAQIETLAPPTEDRAAFARYRLLTRRILGLSDRLRSAFEAGDVAEATRLSDLAQTAQNQRTNAAVDLGSTQCGH
jgi:hypothetical protein